MKDLYEMSEFARSIMEQKYAHEKGDGKKETWKEIAGRVSRHVMKSVDAPRLLVKEIEQAIAERKFMPGGRYLAASGRSFHQVQNCLLLRAEDSREGWADLMQKSSMALMTGAGIGIVYSGVRAKGKPIRKTGGVATGPIELMKMVNEAGRGIVQGGNRRAAIWAGLSWKHQDVFEFIGLKNWMPEVRDLKEKYFDFPATMDLTNISVGLDDEFFKAFNDEKHVLHSHAQSVYWETIKQMLKTAEPGFSVDTGKNSGEDLRNAPVSGNTHILTNVGYKKIIDVVNQEIIVWTGKQWTKTVFRKTKKSVPTKQIAMTGGRIIEADYEHEFFVERHAGKGRATKLTGLVKIKSEDLKVGDILHVSLPSKYEEAFDSNSYTLGYAYGDGSFNKYGGEITFCTDESKKCFQYTNESLYSKINLNDARGYIRVYLKREFTGQNRSKSVYPDGTNLSFLAGLFDADGSYDKVQNRVRLSNVNYEFLEGVRRKLEEYGILSGITKAGISTYGQRQTYSIVVMSEYINLFKKLVPVKRLKIHNHKSYRSSRVKVKSVSEGKIQDVFCCDVKVEEHSFMAEGVIISNCTEVTSSDDSDICNLGSINLARISSLEEMKRVVELGIVFLLAGTVYSDVPYAEVDRVRNKNRRLGLGVMGIHEWLLLNGKKYGEDAELGEYLKIYSESTGIARQWAKKWEISTPIKTRAIAPTGTIGIIGETTTGIEPIFCAAYKRRYKKGPNMTAYQYVLDPTAKKLVDMGINPDDIEDAYTLAEDNERRVAFQEWVQKFVDHGISSTVNIPAWGSELNNSTQVQKFGNMLIKYLPNLRGVTCYPDGGRSGQPLSPVKYYTAAKHVGEVFVEAVDICDLTKSGSCGS